jgi:adenylylsulfate kinase-like enzyme
MSGMVGLIAARAIYCLTSEAGLVGIMVMLFVDSISPAATIETRSRIKIGQFTSLEVWVRTSFVACENRKYGKISYL